MSTDDTPIENDDASEEQEKPADNLVQDLSDGLHDLGKFATGVAGKVLGPRADVAEGEPDRTVVTPEIDGAIEKAGEAVGHWLRSAGEGMTEHPTEPGDAVDATREKGRESERVDSADDDGWSPLVQGARVFSEGVGAVAGELFDTLADEVSRKPKPTTYAQASEE